MGEFVASYRVSTERQQASGPGLEARREAVGRHVGTGQLVAAGSKCSGIVTLALLSAVITDSALNGCNVFGCSCI